MSLSTAAPIIDELVRVPQPDGFSVKPGATAAVLCWGVMPSGRLRHPHFVRA